MFVVALAMLCAGCATQRSDPAPILVSSEPVTLGGNAIVPVDAAAVAPEGDTPEPTVAVPVRRHCATMRVLGERWFICEVDASECERGAQRARLTRGQGVADVSDCFDAGDEPPTKLFDWHTLPGPSPQDLADDEARRAPPDPSTAIGDSDFVLGHGCKRGCVCGGTCIDCSKKCRATEPAPSRTRSPMCRKGCRCGNSCISCTKR